MEADSDKIGTNGAEKIPLTDSGRQCLETIAAFYGISMDAEKIKHMLGISERAMEADDILRAAKKVQLKSRMVKVKLTSLNKLPLPLILVLENNQFAILAKVQEGKLLTVFPDESVPSVLSEKELKQQWTDKVILLIPREKEKRLEKFGFQWFVPTILKYKRPLLEVLLAAFIMQILSIFSPLMTQSIIDKVLVHSNSSTLDVLAVGLIIMLVFETLLSIARNYALTNTTSKMDVILSCRLFDHLFKLPLNYFESRRIGDTVARVRELETIRRFLTGVPLTTMLDCLFLVIYIAILFFYDVTLTWVTIAELPLMILLSAFMTPMLRSRLNDKFDCGAESQSYLVEAVTGVQTIKSFAVEPKIQKRWESRLANYVTAGYRANILSGNIGAAARLIQRGFDVLILWYGATLVMRGDFTVGQLVAFRMLAARVSEPVMRLVQMWQEFQQTVISVDRIGDIFSAPVEPQIQHSTAKAPEIKGSIVFSNVSFRYRPAGPLVIKNMSFEVEPDTTVGIVGRSGSGKSTLSKLVQRLYWPESGKILIDGMDISIQDPSWIRRQIGVVLQENFLFNATIRDNISLQKPAAGMDEIIKVSKIAGAFDFITELANGFDTMVGEQGVGLSGGQRQRIAIARALLSDPKILIFDEATSALDYESESIIQANLKEICRGRTVLIIAHRLSTLRDADKIMVVDRGEVAEFDAREKLVEKKGLFYHLLKQQSEI